ncbi:MAG: hypothetical protein LBK74_00450 [Treponema sp.]|jgi:hypothetical protein|nr:hypothetical protein [Treponema sp.]
MDKQRVFDFSPLTEEELYRRMRERPLSYKEIQVLTGASHAGMTNIITSLSLRYPVYQPCRGLYAVLKD